MARNRFLRLDQDVATRACRTASSPMPKGLFMYPIIALIVLMLFTWIVAIWASCAERDAPDDEEKLEQHSDEQNHQEAALKQDVDRPTASPRLQQKRSCILCAKTRSHTYVFRTPDGGPYGL